MLFLFFLVVLRNFFNIPVVREKIKVKLALATPTAAPTTLVNEQIDTPPVVGLKTIKVFIKILKLLNFLLHDFLWLISW